MDKYEYKLRSEEILKLIEEESYVEAAHIADTIDWRRVKSISMLLRVAALYRVNRRNEDSRAVLLLAYDRYPTNRSVVYSLCEVSIELDDVVAAIEYYKEFVKLAPRDNGVYTLRYRILEAQEANLEERIGVLEELKKRDYQEEWAYELAYLYHRVGLGTKCVEECDDLILWFGDGPYVTKAMELKMLHAPLTAIQQKKYDLVQRQLQGETVEEEQSYYEDENQEAYNEEYSEETYTEGYEQTEYADEMYAQEEYVDEMYAQTAYEQEKYTEEAQYVYADEDNNEYTYYEGNTYVNEHAQEEPYVGSAYAEPVQKQTTGSLDMSQYNTINLQKVVAESMRELFPDDEDIFSSEWTEVSADDVTQMEMAAEQEPIASEVEAVVVETEEPQEEVASGMVETEEVEDIEADAEETVLEQKMDAVPVAVPVRSTNTGRVAAMVTGVSEAKPEPNMGAISKVILPGNDARMMKQDTEIEEIRSVTEEYVRQEQDRIEENQENVYEEQEAVFTEDILPQELTEVSPMTGQMNLEDVLSEWERRKKEIQEKRKEEVKQNVLRQTGKIFQNFDEAVKTGILGELAAEEPVLVRTETFLEEDETEELEEIEAVAEYDEDDSVEQYEEEEGFEEISDVEEEQLSAIEQVIAQELGGDTIDIPQEQVEEALQAMNRQDEGSYAEEMTFEEALADEEFSAEEFYEEEAYIEEEYTEEFVEESDMEEDYEQEEYVDDSYSEEEYLEAEEYDEQDVSEEMYDETEEDQILKTQEISMNTEEISSLPDKIIEATKKETKAVKREELREFTPEEKELFENFAVTKKIRKQIIFALDTMSLAAYTGNVLITGEPGLGTVRLAKNLIREYQAMDANFSGKVAKITGEKLNLRDLREVFDKLKNGAIIIEKANGLTEETLYQLAGLLNQEELGIIVIMEDTRKEITKLLEKQAMIADYFNIRIDLMEMDNDALVAYAKNYALALEYSIDELGTLALYTRIANGQSGNHVVTKDEVREIVDEAIWKSRKFKIKNFVDVLFSKRYDSEDMIVLKERDFI
ncbi:MAG: hypothetical protein IJO85_12070 [Lachnospiraceae bacterium]|nr:hypothetical protein [Lachnospiraceae bacterium]